MPRWRFGRDLIYVPGMRAVIQRVNRASVTVAGEVVGAVDRGLCALVSAGRDDTDADVAWMAAKIAGLRIFPDDQGRMNLDVGAVGGGVLVISQFTLHGDVRKGKRPGFNAAMHPDQAAPMIEAVSARLRDAGLPVAQGRFGADMLVQIANDGPVTILLDSKKTF